MKKKTPLHGTIQEIRGRYYYKVKLPNSKKRDTIALRCPGSKYATKDYDVAVELANQIYLEAKHEQNIPVEIGTVGELITAWKKHIKNFYVESDKKLKRANYSLKLLDEDKNTPVRKFGPLRLMKLRDKLIKKGLCITTINERINKIKAIFEWAVSYQKIDRMISYELTTVKNIKEAECSDLGVKPSEERDPVDKDIIKKTLRCTSPQIRDMSYVQLLTAARPTEILIMKAKYIDTSTDPWHYTPSTEIARLFKAVPKHKNAYRGKKYTRVITIGKLAQEILLPYMAAKKQDEYLFSPSDSEVERLGLLHEKRETPIELGNKPGSNKKNTRNFRDRWYHDSYRKAIEHACRKAFPPPAILGPKKGETKKEWKARQTEAEKEAVKQWEKDHKWTPYQLRHTRATQIRDILSDQKGLHHVQAVLGHKSYKVTEKYAKITQELADKTIKKMDKVGL